MNVDVDSFIQRFSRLSPREKLMVVSAGLLTVWAVWDSLFFQDLRKSNMELRSEITALQNQLKTDRGIVAQLATMKAPDPNADARQQLQHLQQSVGGLKLKLSQGDKKFVAAEQMAGALRDMLKQHGHLKLVKLESLPASPFGAAESQGVWIYKHTLDITLQGDYFSTLSYLKALESLPWRLNWANISYSVKDHPIAETRIQVYTLSFDQEWLRV
ncbi:MAG: hypothetical protein PHH11_08170 [Methylomonas sp.]|nr:hypothetical protein [Methylomonas sp.]